MVPPIIVVVTGSSVYIKNLGTEGFGGNEPSRGGTMGKQVAQLQPLERVNFFIQAVAHGRRDCINHAIVGKHGHYPFSLPHLGALSVGLKFAMVHQIIVTVTRSPGRL